MLHVGMLIIYGFRALLVSIYATAVVIETVNVLAGAAMNAMSIHDHRRLIKVQRDDQTVMVEKRSAWAGHVGDPAVPVL
jgi:hypothetical protein